jgi:hypothetical protein
MELKPLFLSTLTTLSFQVAAPSVIPSDMGPIQAVVRTMNWQPASAVREVRITDWYPNYDGAQVPFLRLVENGAHFDAQFFVWWPKQHSPPMPLAGTAIRCGDDNDFKGVCVKAVAVPVGHDWDDVAARASDLKEPCRREIKGVVSVVADAGDLLIEVLEGRSRRTYSCNAPTSGSPLQPVDSVALDIYKLLVALGRSTPRIH